MKFLEVVKNETIVLVNIKTIEAITFTDNGGKLHFANDEQLEISLEEINRLCGKLEII